MNEELEYDSILKNNRGKHFFFYKEKLQKTLMKNIFQFFIENPQSVALQCNLVYHSNHTYVYNINNVDDHISVLQYIY